MLNNYNLRININNNLIKYCRQKVKFGNLKDQIVVNSHDTSDRDVFKQSLLSIVMNYKTDNQPIVDELIPKSYLDLEELIIKTATTVRARHQTGKKKNSQIQPFSFCFQRNSLTDSEAGTELSVLTDLTVPIIRRKELAEICAQHGIDLKYDELDSALRFLTRSGIILNYEDAKIGLQDLYFLDPAWVCRTVSSIVTMPEIQSALDESGFIDKATLAEHIFRPKRIPDEHHNQIIRLLEVLEIVIEDRKGRYLIPARLPQGRFVTNARSLTKMITRLYGFSTMPIDFWSRVISRFLNFSEFGSTIGYDIWEGIDIDARREGIKMIWDDGTRVVVQSREDDFMVDLINRHHGDTVTWCGSNCPEHMVKDLDLHSWIQISVSNTDKGKIVLGEVIDAIDGIIQEWYPGLVESFFPSIFQFASYIKNSQFVLIPFPTLLRACGFPPSAINCTRSHYEVIANKFKCPVDELYYPVDDVAPDILLNDILLYQPELEVLEKHVKREKLLGVGGFAAVYSGQYNRKQIALKTFSSSLDASTLPYKNLRKELKVLCRIRHPNILSVVGFCVRPEPTLCIELAPEGSLETVLENAQTYSYGGTKLSRRFKHKVIYQVASALSYLHEQNVVYRDLKLGNILIFSRDEKAAVVAKIADYGISEHITPMGTAGYSGTSGYSAPEVVKIRLNQNIGTSTYAQKVDVFSFGLLVHELITECVPWFASHQKTQTSSEPDKLVLLGLVPLPFTDLGRNSWPTMGIIVECCTKFLPSERPNINTIVKMLERPVSLALHSVIPLKSKSVYAVKCFNVQHRLHGASNKSQARFRTCSSSELFDSGDSQDGRFLSHYAEHESKERFDNARKGPFSRSSSASKLLSISPTNLIRNRQAMKAELNRRLEWQMWLLVGERENDPDSRPAPPKANSPLLNSNLLNINFESFGRRSINFLQEKRRTLFAGKEHFTMDAIEFDLNTIRMHPQIGVDINDPLCLLALECDISLHERALVLAGTRQGCIDIYDARHWTIYRSYQHFGCAINQMVLAFQRRFRPGSSTMRSRRSSLPASFLGKRINEYIYVGLSDGRVLTALLTDIIDNLSCDWTDLNVRNAGPVNKLIVEENNGFTQGYALCGKHTITQFTRIQDNLSEDPKKCIIGKSHGYIDIAVGSALYVLQDNRKIIEVYDRITMNFNRQIHIDQYTSKNRRVNSVESTRILSMICVNTGGVNLLLGTSTGEIIIIPDRLLLPKHELKATRYVCL